MRRIRRDELAFNILAGLTLIFWSGMSIREMAAVGELSIVRCCIAALHICVAGLFFFRSPISARLDPAHLATVLASFATAGLAFKLSPEPHRWPLSAELPFAAGTVFAAYSLLNLGRSFAILPAEREIVVRGTYRLVRHPVYLGELLMVGSCCLAIGHLLAVPIFLASLSVLVIRILQEEAMLGRFPEYRDYRNQVTRRLAPWIW